MAVNYVQGQILANVLQRDNIDLSIANANVGIGTLAPQARLDVTGNVLVGNVLIANVGTVSATGNITGGNIITAGFITATGNVTGGNVDTAGLITATGNITGGNIITAGVVTATANIIGGNITTAGVVTATSNVIGGNITTAGVVTATSNVIGGNILTGGLISATSSITSAANVLIGNIVIPATGNIDAGNVNIANLAGPVANSDAATKFYVDNSIGNIGNAGNLTFSNTTISTSLATGNITLAATGNAFVQIAGTYGFVLPSGNTAQRLGTGNLTGTMRFNTDVGRVEVYDGSEWDTVVGGVTNQILNGDGSTLTFVLDRSTTTAAALVMLNGITQVPTQAYNMSPTPSANLVFTEAPATGDVIDIRFL
jgi:hypothetical protein